MKQSDPLKVGFYKVEYQYMNKTMYAVYFTLQEAQEAMMKMIKRGTNVIALHNHIGKPDIIEVKSSRKL